MGGNVRIENEEKVKEESNVSFTGERIVWPSRTSRV
jgi:hypothetical protein